MHELSIAISLVELATEELERMGQVRASAIHLRLGSLSGVAGEALLAAFGQACEHTPLAGSRLVIEEVPVSIFCPKCRSDRLAESVQDMCCRVCGTRSAQVVNGRELELYALEVTDESTGEPHRHTSATG